MGAGLTALHRLQDACFTGLEACQLLDQVRGVRQISWHLLVDPPGVDGYAFDRVEDCWTALALNAEASKPAVSLKSPSRSVAAMINCTPPGWALQRIRGLPSSCTERARPRSTNWVTSTREVVPSTSSPSV